MNGQLSRPQASALLVAITHYDDPAYEKLNEAPKAARVLAKVLASDGYTHAHPELLEGGDSTSISQTLREWLRTAGQGDTVVLYWTGHGKSDSDGFYLITKDSPGTNLNGFNAISASVLGSAVAKSPAEKVLIVLDTCYSGAGARDILETVATVLATRPEQPGRCPAVAVLASAHALKKAQEAVFCKAVTEILDKAYAEKRSWNDNDQFISPEQLAEALWQQLGERPVWKAGGLGQRFLPNPRYRGELPAEDVETRRWRLEAEEHFLPTSRGIEVGEAGWYFSERTRLLSELVNWLKTAEHGLVVVTGLAGAGKSAVLGRLATLSDPTYRSEAARVGALAEAAAETLPPGNIIDVAVHAKGKTLLDCIGALVGALDIELPERERTDPHALIGAIGSLGRRLTVLFDALDEAKPGYPHAIGERLIKPLAALPQVRVLVGTRRSPDGAMIPAGEPRHARLRALFGADAFILDLEDEPETSTDIAQYVRLRLRNSRHRNDHEGIKRVAGAIAENAAGIFLYARIVARTLQDLQRLDTDLPADALEAFVDDLTRRFGDQFEMVHDLLAALAWGEGKGLTRKVWAPVASALSQGGASYNDYNVAWVLGHAGWHIIEAGEDGQAVYRLAHQAFADYYRNRVDPIESNARITKALAAGLQGTEWLDADGYLWRHLASHAAAGGLLDTLVVDPGYLAVADPLRLVSVFPKIVNARARDIAQLYWSVSHELQGKEPLERMAILHLGALCVEPSLVDNLVPPAATAWRCLWAKWGPEPPHKRLELRRSLRTAAIGRLEKRPVLVSVDSTTEAIQLWDLETGSALGGSVNLGDSGSPITAVTIGNLNEKTAVIATKHDDWIRFCYVGEGGFDGADERVMPLHGERIDAIAIATLRGRNEVLFSSAGHVLAFDPGTQQVRETGCHQGSPVAAVDVWHFDDHSVIAYGSEHGAVCLWDTMTNKGLGKRFEACFLSNLRALALAEFCGQLVVVTGCGKDVGVWDPIKGTLLCPLLHGHNDFIIAIDIVDINSQQVIVSVDQSGLVLFLPISWVSSHRLQVEIPGFETMHPELWERYHKEVPAVRSFRSAAVGKLGGQSIVVAAEDTRVTRLQLCTGQRLGHIEPSSDGELRSVVVAKIRTEAVAACTYGSKVQIVYLGSGEKIAEFESARMRPVLAQRKSRLVLVTRKNHREHFPEVFDVERNKPIGKLKSVDEPPEVSVASTGQLGDRPVLVGGHGGSFRLWDLAKMHTIGTVFNFGLANGFLTALAMATIDDKPTIVSADTTGRHDGTLRL